MIEPYPSDRVSLHCGDCLDVLATLPDCSVDAVVTDPPYALDFMGKEWDRFTPAEFARWCEQWAKECLRVLKPGGHLVAFGGTRTWHRLTVGIEDAGFEIRDSISWLYGSGFPKSLDVSKAIDKAAGAQREVIGKSARHVSGKPEQRTEGLNGSSTFSESVGMGAFVTAPATDEAKQWQGWGTALKPAHEPIVVARKPLSGTVAKNVLQHGTGGLNIDGCRVQMRDDDPIHAWYERYAGMDYGVTNEVFSPRSSVISSDPGGRWPANVVLDESAAAELDHQSGITTTSKPGQVKRKVDHRTDAMAGTLGTLDRTEVAYGDSGGASRFFPTFRYQAKAPSKERPKVNGIAHPTVKPVALMRWLVRLVTPPGGTVLDPFAGSGATLQAALEEGFSVIGIEREPDYISLISERLRKTYAA